MIELIITEKPKSAQRIAEALADGKLIKKGSKGVVYYELTHGKNDIIVACAVGHLFGIAEKEKKGMKYPSFDVEWKPLYEINKDAAFSKKYYDTLKKLSKSADVFTIGADLDIEGEVIGLNILRYVCNQKDGRRMKFSTLTKPDIVKAYENASNTIEWGQAIAGETRHYLDFYYGINLSRALTASIKKAGLFKILSIGRVQGPALNIIVQKEKEILVFKPVLFWQLEFKGSVKAGNLIAFHKNDKFWDKKQVELIYEKVKGHSGKITNVKKQKFEQKAPFPFDLTTLQTEAYRCFGIAPKTTLSIAQDLYTSGLVSYPRTSSQQLPQSLGYQKILKQLHKSAEYRELCEKLLKKTTLKPNNGKKTDPAHPAIYPTGAVSKRLEERSQKIFDLIVRRFMSTFAEPAIRETSTINISVRDEPFITSGTRTTFEGWHKFYGSYANMKEDDLPAVHVNEVCVRKELNLLQKETKPPARYTPASIIKELAKRNLGTKSTRAEIIDTLFRRGYASDKAIKATDLGIKTIETLSKYSPKVVDEELTRHFELEMEEILNRKKDKKTVIGEARDILTGILENFKKNEKSIGDNLFEATKESENKANTIGKCLSCGGTLMIKRGKFGKFIACTKYPDCKSTFKLPSNGLIKATINLCDDCKHPKIMVIKKRKKPQQVCINLDCPTKQIKSDKIDSSCEKCSKGKMVLRKSVYGQFLACDQFPKCRNIAKDSSK